MPTTHGPLPNHRLHLPAKEMRERGYTLTEIGEQLSISRERVRQILGSYTNASLLGLSKSSRPGKLYRRVRDIGFTEKSARVLSQELGYSENAIKHWRPILNIHAGGNGSKAEMDIFRHLKELGLRCTLHKRNHPWDITANGLRIDVKECRKAKPHTTPGCSQVRFSVRGKNKRRDADFYILLVTDIKCPAVFIVPSQQVPPQQTHVVFAWPERKRRLKRSWLDFQDRWDLLGATP